MDTTIEMYDEEEEGPTATSKTYTLSIQFIAEHETSTLKR